jgi:outer membrane protein OmpA-like peptidoglycan-associated protein
MEAVVSRNCQPSSPVTESATLPSAGNETFAMMASAGDRQLSGHRRYFIIVLVRPLRRTHMRATIVASIFLSALAAVTGARAAQVELLLSGTGFEGGPGYEVLVGEAVVASGTIVAFAPNAQRAYVTVDDAALAADPVVRVRLINDKYVAGVGDRNVYVMGASIDGRAVPLEVMTVEREGIVRELPAGSRYQPLYGTSYTLFIPTGSPSAPTAAEAAAPATEPPVVVATLVPIVVPTEIPPYSPVVPSFATAAPECDVSVTLSGFGNNGMTVPAEADTALAPLAEQAASGACVVTVTGYASLAGSAVVNQRVSAQRAKLVLDYLNARALRFAGQEAIGAGATDRFGPAPIDNRVVTVELKPAS